MRHRAVRLPGPQGRRHHRAVRGAGDPTHVGSLLVEVRIPASRSLKDKRAALRPIIDGARRRFQVAAAEVEHQDKWQRATLGFATVSGDHHQAEVVLQRVERWVWSFPEVDVLECALHVERPLE